MREAKGGGRSGSAQAEAARPCSKFSNHHLLHNHNTQAANRTAYGSSDDDTSQSLSNRNSSSSVTPSYYSDRSTDSSPYTMSPWNNPQQQHNSQHKSPLSSDHHPVISSINNNNDDDNNNNSNNAVIMIASLVREQGHIYSLAASGDLLYTGSDSKSIRVWKNQHEFGGFKSSSGFVKAIVISSADGRIFTGHQDGKIRVWKASPKNPTVHKRVGSLPRLKDLIKSSIKPSSYVEIRRRTAIWFRHFDAVSCLSLHEQQGILYSGSWDKTFKVWRISDSKCLESVAAHDDAVNSIVAAFDGLLFTGSADGTVKAWRRELRGKGTQHSLVQTLLKNEYAVTALAVSPTAPFVYCGSSDGVVNFWEWERRQLAHGGVLRGHKQAVLCLATAGSLVLSGSADASICVWRREGGVHSRLSVLTGHTGPVKCLAAVEDKESNENITEGGRWIVYSGSLDKSVKVWRVSEHPAAEALLHGPQNVPSEPSSGGYRADGHDMDHGRKQHIWTAA